VGPPGPLPGRDESQPAEHLAHHLLVNLAEEQRQRDHVIDDQPRRKQALSFLFAARFQEHLIDQIPRVNPRDHP
jgi:hypothetical protein